MNDKYLNKCVLLTQSRNRWKIKKVHTLSVYEQRQNKQIEIFYVSGRPIFNVPSSIEVNVYNFKKNVKKKKMKPWRF